MPRIIAKKPDPKNPLPKGSGNSDLCAYPVRSTIPCGTLPMWAHLSDKRYHYLPGHPSGKQHETSARSYGTEWPLHSLPGDLHVPGFHTCSRSHIPPPKILEFGTSVWNAKEFSRWPVAPDGGALEKNYAGITNPTATPPLVFTTEIIKMMAEISALTDVYWYMGVPFNDTQHWRLQIAEVGEAMLGNYLIGLQVREFALVRLSLRSLVCPRVRSFTLAFVLAFPHLSPLILFAFVLAFVRSSPHSLVCPCVRSSVFALNNPSVPELLIALMRSLLTGRDTRKSGNSNDKARQEDSDDEEDEEDLTQEEHNEEEEQRFEELNGEAIRQRLEQKRNTFGGIAEHGIIESIEMHHFMCHKRLTFTFGPQINFIIGHIYASQFFLRGTQLSQLSEEYDACLDNINQTKKVLHQKKQVPPDLRAAFKEASVRFEEASKAREQRCKVDELKKELAWAHVAATQAVRTDLLNIPFDPSDMEMEAKLEEVAKAERRLRKIEAEMKTAESQFQLASDAVEQFDKADSALGDIDHLTKQRDDLQEKMRGNRVKIGNFKNDEKQMNTSLNSLSDAIKNYTRNIAEEEHRLAADTQVKRDELNRKLESARTDVTNADQAHKDFLEAKRQKLADQDSIKRLFLSARSLICPRVRSFVLAFVRLFLR
ncbi:uncharacterized protein F5891DRAFT_1191845 [Suillus fuscotomentosus]|uniref:Uncharacterized protein n=1 Tax=Suillus fuscotomentosus TaxID=1912939 RepID=A0AAD4E0P8_9AGAM|nr:uncharacterized protein F5891DRAFT_1191845 [Suillus fuscotomentosus]KAG1897410.1 hypothetical protein F5891DRAFT_1191845 [Suillus fuscotomentosus]